MYSAPTRFSAAAQNPAKSRQDTEKDFKISMRKKTTYSGKNGAKMWDVAREQVRVTFSKFSMLVAKKRFPV